MLNNVGDIIHASCSCPAGSDPICTCKHTAALCYELEDFVKLFVLPEDIPSCTCMYIFKLRHKANNLNKVCDTERAFAETFLCELEQWIKESNPSKKLLINTVASQDAPVKTLVYVNPLYDYVEKVKNNITNISHSNSMTNKTELKNCFKVTEDEQLLIQVNTLPQSRLPDWFTSRQLRITGYIVSRFVSVMCLGSNKQ
ncbi:hypothetical protein ACJMK2_030351 [Sinanodonta woodiana]|uniref:SWIM-type domain-containing protein n=1 Tax=Sinanodonta woodiana TaxID=1069815 RepID=A0ABD3XES7_SINWO